jgi:hypothetical protein
MPLDPSFWFEDEPVVLGFVTGWTLADTTLMEGPTDFSTSSASLTMLESQSIKHMDRVEDARVFAILDKVAKEAFEELAEAHTSPHFIYPKDRNDQRRTEAPQPCLPAPR